ncbi:MAG TPA: hypothetical protein VK949_09315 [Methylotenera sp.]|nr:hypothetical protein [Methylotenera sp.]
MIIFDDGPTGILDRIFGAVFAFVMVAITLILIPVAIALKTHFVGPHFMFKVGHVFSITFFLWIGFVSIISLVYGALFGTTSVIIMLGHLWGTSTDPELTHRVWLILIVCGLITFGLVLNWDYLMAHFK